MNEENLKTAGVFEGVLAILFGIAAVFWPDITIVTLLYLFAGFILASGIINFLVGIFSISRGGSHWLLKSILGLVQLGAGVYLFRHPTVTFATFILIIGFVLITRGVIDIVLAFTNETTATNKTMLSISGLLSVLVGIVILFQPAASGVAFVWLLGLFALISGPIIIAASVDNNNNKVTRKAKRA